MAVIYPPPERISPEAKSHTLYISKDERLLVRIYNWYEPFGYTILVRFYDRNGVERYIRKDGISNTERYITDVYMELEEGYLTGVNVYAASRPGAKFRPFFALVALTHGQTRAWEITTTLTYGIAGYSTPLSWPPMPGPYVEDYLTTSFLDRGNVGSTMWSWTPAKPSEILYLYFSVTLGGLVGTRKFSIRTQLFDLTTAGARVLLDAPGETYHIIVAHDIAPNIVGRTIYINLPTFKHLDGWEVIEVMLSDTLEGDQIDYFMIRWVRLPWVRR